VLIIKNAYDEHEVIPDMGSLKFRLLEQVKDEIDRKFLLTQLRRVEEAELNDTQYVQETAMKFCKQQELIRSMIEIDKIIKKGDINDYDQCEEILKKALMVGDNKDGSVDVFHDMANVLSDDFRQPIPTGIHGLDDIMEGGLSKGELGVILAPFGVGKTTLMTKIANTAFNEGKKVLQIFFEDMPKVIQRKHLSCWSGIELNNLTHHKKQLDELVKEKEKSGGTLKLHKMPSHGTTIHHVKQFLRKQIASGFRPDMIIIDYIDCVSASRRIEDNNVAEGAVMREFETLLAEFDLAGWTAVQGNRSSINADQVDSTMIGGSIKRGQIGHFILSIAKNMVQKENGTANIAILKSRFGKDGIVLPDCVFNNATVQIEMTEHSGGGSGQSFYEAEQNKQAVAQKRVNEIAAANLRRKQALDEENKVKGVENVGVTND
jgi:replicative DNA helicase